MPASHYAAWARHFQRHPPGNAETHYLLALLISCVTGIFGQPLKIDQIAPWLPGRADSTPEITPTNQSVMAALAEGKYTK